MRKAFSIIATVIITYTIGVLVTGQSENFHFDRWFMFVCGLICGAIGSAKRQEGE